MTSSSWTRPGANIEGFSVGDEVEVPFIWGFVGSGCAGGLSGSGLCIEFMLMAVTGWNQADVLFPWTHQDDVVHCGFVRKFSLQSRIGFTTFRKVRFDNFQTEHLDLSNGVKSRNNSRLCQCFEQLRRGS